MSCSQRSSRSLCDRPGGVGRRISRSVEARPQHRGKLCSAANVQGDCDDSAVCPWLAFVAVVVGTSVSYVISWVILAARARRELAPTGAARGLDLADTLSVLRYSLSLTASLIFITCIRSTDSLFLGHFGSAADVGRYGAVVMVAQLIGLLGLAIGQTLGARIALCHGNNDIAGMEGLLAESIRLTSLFSAPVFAAIVFWGDRIDLVLGPTFGVDAWVVSIVAARVLVHTIFGYSGFALSLFR
jgi:O-antigen/teichoic acid export membrane protein